MSGNNVQLAYGIAHVLREHNVSVLLKIVHRSMLGTHAKFYGILTEPMYHERIIGTMRANVAFGPQ